MVMDLFLSYSLLLPLGDLVWVSLTKVMIRSLGSLISSDQNNFSKVMWNNMETFVLICKSLEDFRKFSFFLCNVT